MKSWRYALALTVLAICTVAVLAGRPSSTGTPERPPSQAAALSASEPSSDPFSGHRGRNPLDQGADNCPGTPILDVPYSDAGTTAGRANNFTQCGPNTAPDVVYSYVPVLGGLYTVSLCGSAFDTRLEVRTDGPCPGLMQIACNDNACGLQSLVSMTWNPGIPVYIIVDGRNALSYGNYVMQVFGPCEVPFEPGYIVECAEIPGPAHYTEDCDGGCNVNPHQFGAISPGLPVWGRCFTYLDSGGGAQRDGDWYEFTVTEPSRAVVRVTAEFPVAYSIIDYMDCSVVWERAHAVKIEHCQADSITSDELAPGSYAVVVSPVVNTGMDIPRYYTCSLRLEPVPPGGSLELSADVVHFEPTYVGMQSMVSITVTNVHPAQTLQVDSITTTGHIWGASPGMFTLMPGQFQIVDLTFQPTFEHDFEGFIEIYSSDPLNPRDSVAVSGLGCQQAVMPPPPLLYDAASPSDIYFAIPWDANGTAAEYLIEYSADGFVTTDTAFFFDPGSDPFEGQVCWAAAGAWGEGGDGVISDLMPSTSYQVRLRVRDCTGYTVEGPPAMMHTSPPLAPDAYRQLTILVINADTVELNWDPEIRDTLGNLLPNMGDLIYFGTTPGIMDSVVGWSAAGSLRLPISSSARGFFYIEPVLQGVYDQPSPFIAWPPEGAAMYGMNSVVIHDFAHFSQWDSFRVEIDSAGFTAQIGSSWDNPWSFAGRRMAVADFDEYGVGPHLITVTVVDRANRSWQTIRNVTVVAAPFATFDAAYDSLRQVFHLDTMSGSVVTPGPLSEIYWPTSTAGERYGGSVEFGWNTTNDSVTVVKPIPVCSTKTISNEQPAPKNSDPAIAVVPKTSQPKRTPAQVGWCCVSLSVTPGQPVIVCKGGSGTVTVGLPFRVDVVWRAEENAGPYSHGQDAKGDRTYTYGKCKGAPPVFTPNPSSPSCPNPIVLHKRHKGKDYALDSSAWGDDDYHRDRRDNHLHTDIRRGTTRWNDFPSDRVNKPAGQAVRVQGHNAFKAWARTKCPTEPVGACCKLFEIDWDIICCQNGTLITNTAPNMSGLRPCPDE